MPALVITKPEQSMGLLNPVNKSLCLEQLCEANYLKLLRLIPGLCSVKERAVGIAEQKSALSIRILERNPYTLTIELNHHFKHAPDPATEPALQIRVYLDAKSAEVLCDYIRPTVNKAIKQPCSDTAVMDYKWRLNYFLSKWLDHCLQAEYRFQTPLLVEA